MLNYIFDIHNTINKHQHHRDNRWGPHFEGESQNVTAQAGATVILDCKISLLQGKTVSIIIINIFLTRNNTWLITRISLRTIKKISLSLIV